MLWLWILGAVILVLFLLVLCWLFFPNYICWPCQQRRSQESVLPTHVTPHSDHVPSSTFSPSAQEPVLPRYVTPRSARVPKSTFSPSAREPVLPTTHVAARPTPIPSSSSTRIPSDSPHLRLKYADLSVRRVIKIEHGIPTLDLHNMTVKEATKITRAFLATNIGQQHRVRIITGRGLHSEGGVAKVKPAIETLLENQNLKFSETNSGGCLNVILPNETDY